MILFSLLRLRFGLLWTRSHPKPDWVSLAFVASILASAWLFTSWNDERDARLRAIDDRIVSDRISAHYEMLVYTCINGAVLVDGPTAVRCIVAENMQ